MWVPAWAGHHVLSWPGCSCCCCSQLPTEAGHQSRGELQDRGARQAGGHARHSASASITPPPAPAWREVRAQEATSCALRQLEHLADRPQTRPPTGSHLLRLHRAAPQARPVMPRATRQGRVGHGPEPPGSGERPAPAAAGSPGENRNQQRGLTRRERGQRRQPGVNCWGLTASSTTASAQAAAGSVPTATPQLRPQGARHWPPLAHHAWTRPAATAPAQGRRNQQRPGHAAPGPITPNQSHQDGSQPGSAQGPAPRSVSAQPGLGGGHRIGPPQILWRSRWWARRALRRGPW